MALTYFTKRPNLLKNPFITRQLRAASSKTSAEIEDENKPIEYLKSEAAKLKAIQVRSGTTTTTPWFQPYVISFSLGVFMLYFFILREESDIDQEFSRSLYDRIEGLEERNLEIVLEYNRDNQLPTEDIERKLQEIRSNK